MALDGEILFAILMKILSTIADDYLGPLALVGSYCSSKLLAAQYFLSFLVFSRKRLVSGQNFQKPIKNRQK